MKQEQRKGAKASIYHDAAGRIVAIVMSDVYQQGPPTGIVSPPDCRCYEVELSGELAGVPLLDLHTGYRVDLAGKEPRLVRAD